jgi:hypothetical protein
LQPSHAPDVIVASTNTTITPTRTAIHNASTPIKQTRGRIPARSTQAMLVFFGRFISGGGQTLA